MSTGQTPKITIVSGTRDSAPVMFVDGVAEINFGPSVCKVAFHQSRPSQSGKGEDRHVVLTMVVPTAALAEMSYNILGSMHQNKSRISSTIDKQNKKLFDIIDDVNAVAPDAEPATASGGAGAASLKK